MLRNIIGDLVRLVRGTYGCIRCGHGSTDHLHYRRGTDCALCDCKRWS